MRTVLITLVLLLGGCGIKAPQDAAISLDDLYDLRYLNYKVDPYIETARKLQALGKEKAIRKLLDLAEDEEQDRKIFILCRMLFSQRGTSLFERPALGGASFFGGTNYADWLLEPIEIVDGIPFVVVKGYHSIGQALPARHYIMYCFQMCDWNVYQYQQKSFQQKREALKKLLASPKWKEPVPEDFFAKQIE